MRPRPTRGLLIRLLDERRNQIAESFQSVCIRVYLNGRFRVPRGWVGSWAGASGTSILNPTLAVVVVQHDGAVEQWEADPQAVGSDQRHDRPQEHALKQVVERAEEEAPQAVPVAQDDFRLAVECPRRAYRHCRFPRWLVAMPEQ